MERLRCLPALASKACAAQLGRGAHSLALGAASTQAISRTSKCDEKAGGTRGDPWDGLNSAAFPGSDYQAYIHTSKYARWLPRLGRREYWNETVARYFNFMERHLADLHGYRVPAGLRDELEASVRALEVMPSMRALMTAGPALEKSNIAGYNCSYLPIDSPAAFHEALYVLMHGTGVGFSVERRFTGQLPAVPARLTPSSDAVYVADSREGWADAVRELVAGLFQGRVRELDVSGVRPEGSILHTFGGLASGPEPLLKLHEFFVKVFREAAGRQLTPLECHDLICNVGEVVVVGGVRRSALISLSDLGDQEMRGAKSGAWWESAPWRYIANNSAVYEERPSQEEFDAEWAALVASGTGERGIFSRSAAASQCTANRGRKTEGQAFGTNPCSEIILRPQQFCNLTEVVVRSGDSEADLARKVRHATILGTWQSTLTKWKESAGGLRPIWRKNTEEERLLGVSMTGILDNELTSGQRGMGNLRKALEQLRSVAVATNVEAAGEVGINTAAAITCVKPSGTVSQLVNAASGIHPRHSRFYLRRVRGHSTDPLTQFLIQAGVPHEQCVYNAASKVFSFPLAAPPTALVRENLAPIRHLELCLTYQKHWCEHKPSVTISVKEQEWSSVGRWVYSNFDVLAGVSFLPFDMGTYQQTPYESISEEEYLKCKSQLPESIDWRRFQEVERGARDYAVGRELACSSGECESVGEPVDRT